MEEVAVRKVPACGESRIQVVKPIDIRLLIELVNQRTCLHLHVQQLAVFHSCRPVSDAKSLFLIVMPKKGARNS
jgi:hypothetical protein